VCIFYERLVTANPNIKSRQIIINRYLRNLHKNVTEAIKGTNINYCVLSDSIFLFIKGRSPFGV
jgi:hypothetical protein